MDHIQDSVRVIVENAYKNSCNADDLFRTAERLTKLKNKQRTVHSFLDICHLPVVNRTISEKNLVTEWLNMIIALISHSNYSIGHMLYHRSKRYADKIMFQEIRSGKVYKHTYGKIWNTLVQIASVFHQIEQQSKASLCMGILTPNCLQGSLIDLAALAFHFRVVPIPANAANDDINFIIEHSGITHLFIDPELRKNLILKKSLPLTELQGEAWNTFLRSGEKINPVIVLKRVGKFNMDDLATIMYSSGTTGEPKGITFTQANLTIKRFARALALPDIGPNDIFLSYLPLYHTFGRFLEMQGSIFWGATYTFAENSSFEALLNNFVLVQPTVFISVPKRWVQIYETIRAELVNQNDSTESVQAAIKKFTGGHLQWGLSAAGYLDPDIFQFFQQHNIHLLSGYGMTEATGGITMTPVSNYIPDSVGKALPGIELKLNEERELLIRGPYVSKFYFGRTLTPIKTDGWFHTGDIFQEKNGHYFIEDRKKEIYKNAAGQTITPQKIENMLQEFDAVQSAFLVGDHLNYNTVLIFPNPEYIRSNFPDQNAKKIRNAIATLIQTVNGFLAPFEQMINFAIISRNFSAEFDELTPKGTYKRKNIFRNWKNVIEPMYAIKQNNLEHGDKKIIIPNWLLKELKIVFQDITWDGNYLTIDRLNKKCRCQWQGNILTLGNFDYNPVNDQLNLETLVQDPRLWLGNQEFVDFIGDLLFRVINFTQSTIQIVNKKAEQFHVSETTHQISGSLLVDLHNGTHKILLADVSGLDLFYKTLQNKQVSLQQIAIDILMQFINSAELEIGRQIFLFLIPYLQDDQLLNCFRTLFIRYQQQNKIHLFNISSSKYSTQHLEVFLKEIHTANILAEDSESYIKQLMELTFEITQKQLSHYRYLRYELMRIQLFSKRSNLTQKSAELLNTLDQRLKSMLRGGGKQLPNAKYSAGHSWKNMVEFDPVIHEHEKKYIQEIFETLPIVKESIFISTNYKLVHLENIQAKGIWVTPIVSQLGIKQYRILINLRDGDAYNFVLYNLDEISDSDFLRICQWQIVQSDGLVFKGLINNYLTGYLNQKIIISEYVTSANIYSYLKDHIHEINNPRLRDRWDMRWLHFGWSAMQRYIDSWTIVDFKYAVQTPSLKNVNVSEYENDSNVRLTHILFQKETQTKLEVIFELYKNLILETEKEFTGLNHLISWEIIFTSILQSIGKSRGLIILNDFIREIGTETKFDLNRSRIEDFISEVEKYGYLSKAFIFACLRYERWLELNPKATNQTKITIMRDLSDDYHLQSVIKKHPQMRIRYFLMTCFKDENTNITKTLYDLSSQLYHQIIAPNELETRIHELTDDPSCSESNKYFLARLIYEHIDPAKYAELITHSAGKKILDLAVQIKNKDGKIFTIRPPLKPKEIAQFHDLLLTNNFFPYFREEHKFLIIVNENNQLAGGVYWKMTNEKSAYINQLAIHEKYQRSGLGKSLILELMHRITKLNVTQLSAEMTHIEFFQKLGFQKDASFPGLVKELNLNKA